MLDYYDTSNSMSSEKVREECHKLYKETGDTDVVLDFLAELASEVYSCPDMCDAWAMNELEYIRG